MKMNINKACDLQSISVFPPNLRRRSAEPQVSQQLRSQPSQQSFSQGPSSQRGGFSQSSVEEFLINDPRFCSQERDPSLKKVSCLPPINHRREDSQLVGSRSSSSLTRRWSSASVGESKLTQISEELEQRFGMIETSLCRFSMMLDSMQNDIMQANRGTKEVFLETERIQQKLVLQDTSLQQLVKEQAVVKASLVGGVKSILEEFSKNPNQEKLEKICLMLTAIPNKVETVLQQIKREICHKFTRDIQDLASLKMPEPRVQVPTIPQVKVKENLCEQRGFAAKVLTSLKMPETRVQVPTAPQAKENLPEQRSPATKSNTFCNTILKTNQPPLPRNPYNVASSRAVKTNVSLKIQMGCWKTVKPEQSRFTKRAVNKQVKFEGTRTQLGQCGIVIDLDEDIDGGFSCLIDENTKGTNFEWDAEKETERILKTARRTKRKFGNPIIIN